MKRVRRAVAHCAAAAASWLFIAPDEGASIADVGEFSPRGAWNCLVDEARAFGVVRLEASFDAQSAATLHFAWAAEDAGDDSGWSVAMRFVGEVGAVNLRAWAPDVDPLPLARLARLFDRYAAAVTAQPATLPLARRTAVFSALPTRRAA